MRIRSAVLLLSAVIVLRSRLSCYMIFRSSRKQKRITLAVNVISEIDEGDDDHVFSVIAFHEILNSNLQIPRAFLTFVNFKVAQLVLFSCLKVF